MDAIDISSQVHTYVERCIRDSLETVDTYLNSPDFTPIWRAWGALYIHDSHIRDIITSMFTIQTPSAKLLCTHILRTAIAILNIIKMMYVIDNGSYACLSTPKLSYIISDYVFHTSESILYHVRQDVCVEYTLIAQSVCIIQRAWRTCITNPRYIICKRRLRREFHTLVDGEPTCA